MHGLLRATHRRRQRASPRRHFRHGWRAAAVRAFTAAGLYLNEQVPTLTAAAERCGSNVLYVRAAIVLIKHETLIEQERVLRGQVPLLEAANQAWRQRKVKDITVDEAVMSWRRWTPEQRAEFGRGAGIAELWDSAIVPSMDEQRASQQAAE
jgi:hypothetical protein